MLDNLVNQTGLNREDIVSVLPSILMEIRNYTNQYFLTTTNMKITKIKENKVYHDDKFGKLKYGDCIELLNSLDNTSLYFVDEVFEDYFTVEGTLSDETPVRCAAIKLSFQGVSTRVLQGFITYEHATAGVDGIISQSLGEYSVTYARPTSGYTSYPLELYGGLNALRKMHDDFAEYRRKGYVRVQ